MLFFDNEVWQEANFFEVMDGVLRSQRGVKFMSYLKYLSLLCLFSCLAMPTQSEAAEISTLIETDDGTTIKLTQLEQELLQAALQDLSLQYYKAEEQVKSKQRLEGALVHNEQEYWYSFENNELFIFSEKGELFSQIPLQDVVSGIVNAAHPEFNTNKCPWCIVAAGILISQGICTLSAGGEHTYCQATCQCGVSSVSTTCVAGYRSTTCECMPCPTPPEPGPDYPSPGGTFFGTPWSDYNNNGDGPGYPLCVSLSIDGDC